MRNVRTLSGQTNGFTVGRRRSRGVVEIAVLWDTDDICWYSEAELDTLLIKENI